MEDIPHGLIDNWLQNIKDVYRKYRAKIEALEHAQDKLHLMCELNVVEQVKNVCHTTIVQNAWKSGQELAVHGWIYSIKDGRLKDLNVCVTSFDEYGRLTE